MNFLATEHRQSFSLNFLLFLTLSIAVIGVGFATGWISSRLEQQALLKELAFQNDQTLSILKASLLEPLSPRISPLSAA